MPIPLQCAAEGCSFREELPDGSTVKGKPALQWWREDCDYRCRQHRNGDIEHDRAVALVQRELGAEIIMDANEAHHRTEAYARKADPETSHEAAESVTEIKSRQKAIYTLLEVLGPMTDEKIAFEYEQRAGTLPKQSSSGMRTRRAELVDLGRVVHTGEYGETKAGNRTRIWAVVGQAPTAKEKQDARDAVVRAASVQSELLAPDFSAAALEWAATQKIVRNIDGKWRSLLYHEPGRKIL